MRSSHNYLLVINGKPDGPFTVQQLHEMKIRPGDFVKTDEMDDYKEAHEVAELRQLFGFQKQALLQYFGSFDQRLMASALDWFFVSGACVLPVFIASVFVTDKMVRMVITLSLLAIIPIVKLLYHIVMEASAKQATFGKQILKIRVCDMQGNRLGIGQSVGRNLGKIFSVLSLFTGYLYCFFNKQQQCLHDVMAGTLVVKDRLV